MKILLGVSGGIAAYKAAELVRTLQQNKVDVLVAMTGSAERFITPLTFAALTGHPVFTSLWQPTDTGNHFDIEHISAAQDIDALVVAPATANLLARFAQGLADDFLTTLYLANTAPVLLAPTMNVNMWNHPATRANVRTLIDRGHRVVEPEPGYLACGMIGGGRLAAIDILAAEVLKLVRADRSGDQDLVGETILITAGGTREPLDPVRFLGNRSSGKMGHALAEAAVARGAKVILVTAAALPDPVGCKVLRVLTAIEMQSAVLADLPEATMVIAAAAVADFRPRSFSPVKLRRAGGTTLDLIPTEDIVARVVAERPLETLVIAFAAETDHLESNARAKLLRKGADAIVANDVAKPGLGFDADNNAGLFITPNQVVELGEASKRVIADRVLSEARLLRVQARATSKSA